MQDVSHVTRSLTTAIDLLDVVVEDGTLEMPYRERRRLDRMMDKIFRRLALASFHAYIDRR